MKPDPRPDEPVIASAEKLLREYSERAAVVKVAPPGASPGTAAAPEKKAPLDVYSEKLASLEQLINSGTKAEGDPFQKLRDKIGYELARPPVRLSLSPETPEPPAETGRDPGKSPGPPPAAPSAAVNAPVPRRRALLYVPAAALALLLAGFGVYRQARENSAAYYREYPLATANISALVWAEGKLFAGDWLAQAVYVYSADGDGLRLEKTFPLKNTHISGLAVAGDTLYVADSWKKTIEARRIAPGLPLLKSFPSPARVSALFYDGEYLWTCDSEGNAVLRRPGAALTPAFSFKLAEKPDQLFKDKNFLWTAVSSTGKLYRRKLDGGLTRDGVYTLKTARPDFPLSAFAWRGSRLWLARDGLQIISEAGRRELVKE